VVPRFGAEVQAADSGFLARGVSREAPWLPICVVPGSPGAMNRTQPEEVAVSLQTIADAIGVSIRHPPKREKQQRLVVGAVCARDLASDRAGACWGAVS
jgi:hypothetical protein